MKKVLFVIETLCGGGAERALSNITTHFPEDWQIDILLNDESLIGYPYGGNILSLSRPEKKSMIYYTVNIVKRIFYLKKLKKHNGYDACISFLDSANISNILSGNKYCKTVVSIRSNVLAEKADPIVKFGSLPLTKRLYIHADKIVTVSKEIESALVSRLKVPENKVRAIINGYDREWIRDQMKRIPKKIAKDRDFISDGRKVVVTVGRIAQPKGQWHLVRAFSEVVRRQPGTVLFIVGDGPLKRYLEELIRAYGLENHVFLVGHSSNPFWYDGIADVFVLPSLYEGYPNALAEAVCCGTPCIAADVHSGPREILAPDLDVMGERVSDIFEGEYGLLVPVCSGSMYGNGEPLAWEEEKMAEAIVTLLRDGGKREYYRKKCAERGKDLDINRIVAQWIDVILEDKGN